MYEGSVKLKCERIQERPQCLYLFFPKIDNKKHNSEKWNSSTQKSKILLITATITTGSDKQQK